MLFLVVCLGFLILGVCYYSVKEVHLQERQAKTVYERTILLSAINSTKKKVEEGLAGKKEEEGKEGVECGDNSHQKTTISSSSFGSTTNSSTVNSNTFVTTTLSNSSTPDLPPLPPTPPPEMDSSEKLMTMRRIPLEAVLVNGKGGSINGGVTVSSVKRVNSSGPTGSDEPRTQLVLQSFSSAV